jgi:hypothetical protein
MAAKLVVYARRAGVEDVALVEDAYWAALQPRLNHYMDVFHHDLLHPARTVLILIEQADCRNGALLAAAALTETLSAAVRVPVEVARALNERVGRLVELVPNPLDGGEALLEQLVTAQEESALIAVAERLDHARHLHMREAASWRAFYEQVEAVYLPVAQRVHQQLFRRFERWATAFQRRLA